jgi:hypothetical protein
MRLPRLSVGVINWLSFLVLSFIASLCITFRLIDIEALEKEVLKASISKSSSVFPSLFVNTFTTVFIVVTFTALFAHVSLRLPDDFLCLFILSIRDHVLIRSSEDDGDIVNCEDSTIVNLLLKKCNGRFVSDPTNKSAGTLLFLLTGFDELSTATIIPGSGLIMTSKHSAKHGLLSMISRDYTSYVEKGRTLTLPDSDVSYFGKQGFPSIAKAPKPFDVLYLQSTFGSIRGVVSSVLKNSAIVLFPRLPGTSGSPVFTSSGNFLGIYSQGNKMPNEKRTYSIICGEDVCHVEGDLYQAIIHFFVDPSGVGSLHSTLSTIPVESVEHTTTSSGNLCSIIGEILSSSKKTCATSSVKSGGISGITNSIWSFLRIYLYSICLTFRRQIFGTKIASRIRFLGRIVGSEIHNNEYDVCVIKNTFINTNSMVEHFQRVMNGHFSGTSLHLQPLDVH